MNEMLFRLTRVHRSSQGWPTQARQTEDYLPLTKQWRNCWFITVFLVGGRTDASPTVGDVYEALSVGCWLGWDGPNRTSNTQPLVEVGKGIREMQHDTAHGRLDPDSEFEKPLAQGADLRGSELTNPGTQA
jgi:hypothetical protein